MIFCWVQSWRADPSVRPLADRHYNRQKVGSKQFSPPGRDLVLKTPDHKAYWITSWPFAEYVKHRWAGAWVCSAFRNEGTDLATASDLIVQAVAATRWKWPAVPDLGMVTFIDRSRVRPTMVRGQKTWGYTYKKAGFEEVGETEGGLLALLLKPERMPPPVPPLPRSYV